MSRTSLNTSLPRRGAGSAPNSFTSFIRSRFQAPKTHPSSRYSERLEAASHCLASPTPLRRTRAARRDGDSALHLQRPPWQLPERGRSAEQTHSPSASPQNATQPTSRKRRRVESSDDRPSHKRSRRHESETLETHASFLALESKSSPDSSSSTPTTGCAHPSNVRKHRRPDEIDSQAPSRHKRPRLRHKGAPERQQPLSSGSSILPTDAQVSFRLLDLPLEMIFEVLDRVEESAAVQALLTSCALLRNVVPLAYLLHHKVIKMESCFVHVTLLDCRLRPHLVTRLLGCLPPFSSRVWIEIGLDLLVSCKQAIRPFFETQTVMDLRVQWRENDACADPEVILSLYSVLECLGPALDTLTLETVESFPSQSLRPSFDTLLLPTDEPRRRLPAVDTLRSLTISMQWSRLPNFSYLWAALAACPGLCTVTLSEVVSEEECNTTLRSLTTGKIQDLYLLTSTTAPVVIDQAFLQRQPDLDHFSLLCLAEPSSLLRSPALMSLPGIPEIRMSSHFASFSAVDASAISKLSLRPVRMYGPPLAPAYCETIEVLLASVRSLSALPISGLELGLEFPWRLSSHLSARVPGCRCRDAASEFSLSGVRVLRMETDDSDDELVTLAHLFSLSRSFAKVEEVYCNMKRKTFHQAGGVVSLDALRACNPSFRSLHLKDDTWQYDAGMWRIRVEPSGPRCEY